MNVECKIEIGAQQASKQEHALPGLEHDRRAADSAAGTGAGVRAGHDRPYCIPVALARPRVRNWR